MTLYKNVIGSFRFSLSHDLPELSCSLPHIRNREDRKPRVGTGRAGNRSGKIKLRDSNTGDAILPSINVKRRSGTKSQDQGVGSNYQNHLESFIKLPGIPDKMKHGPKPRPSEHLLKNEGPISFPQLSRNKSLVGAMCNMKEEDRNERRTDGRPQDSMSFLPHPPSAARTTQVTKRQRFRRQAMRDLYKY